MNFLQQVKATQFALIKKRSGKIPEEWARYHRSANYRKLCLTENKKPDEVYHIIGKKNLKEGFTEYMGVGEGYTFVLKNTITVYEIANALTHKKLYAREEDLKPTPEQLRLF